MSAENPNNNNLDTKEVESLYNYFYPTGKFKILFNFKYRKNLKEIYTKINKYITFNNFDFNFTFKLRDDTNIHFFNQTLGYIVRYYFKYNIFSNHGQYNLIKITSESKYKKEDSYKLFKLLEFVKYVLETEVANLEVIETQQVTKVGVSN